MLDSRPAAGRLPNFLIVGAMRAGSTSLWQYLRGHPEVFVVPDKALLFFTEDRYWNRGVDWYRECFAEAGDAAAVGEAHDSYMFKPVATERMASIVPEAKLIAILRNPVERAYSHYWHAKNRRGWETRSFADAVAPELEGTEPPPPPAPHDYLAKGRYLEQLTRVCRHYPREALLVVLLEDLDARPKETFAEVCRFLEVDDTVFPEHLGAAENSYLEHRAQPLWRFMMRHRLWRFVPMRDAVVRLMVRRDVRPPAIEPALRQRLVEYFATANAELADWLGRDLSHWSDPPATGSPGRERPTPQIDAVLRRRA